PRGNRPGASGQWPSRCNQRRRAATRWAIRSTAFWNSGPDRRSSGTDASISNDLALQSRSYSYHLRNRSASDFIDPPESYGCPAAAPDPHVEECLPMDPPRCSLGLVDVPCNLEESLGLC